jgi:hypothetical protein
MWQGPVRLIPINFGRYKHFGLVILPKAERISPIIGTAIPLSISKMAPKGSCGQPLTFDEL